MVGSLRIAKPQFKVLLVFAKNDDQCQAWKESLEYLEFVYDVVSSEKEALNQFKKIQHHLVIIEDQCPTFNTKQLCSFLHGTHKGNYTTFVAILSKRYYLDGTSPAQSFLAAGFNQVIRATTIIKEIKDNLLQLEAGPLTSQLKLRSCQAVFTALERSRDLIQIADEHFKIQYVNRMFEQATGYSAKDVVGESLSFYFENETNEKDAWRKTKENIQSGKEWFGFLYMKQKEGRDLQTQVVVLPLTGLDGLIHQYVVVSQITLNNVETSVKERKFHETNRNKPSTSESHLSRRASVSSSPDGDGPHKRSILLPRIRSWAAEAPITQIIHLIRTIKENSRPPASEYLERILDILSAPSLYLPSNLPNQSRNPMLSDFVEGLVTTTGFSYRRPSGGTGENLLGKSPPSGGMKPCQSENQSPTLASIDPVITACLRGSDSWNYDILELERVTIKKPLVNLGMHILNQFNACDVLCCSPATLHSWLVVVESKYHSSNPYHNSTHAADVLHATAYFLRKERVSMWMESFDEVSALLAAIIHDVDHPGRTNAFLINSNSHLAILYNDTAVLESHHAALAFNITVNNDKCNIFKNMPQESFRSIRQSIIDMVLATELSKHFEHVNKFLSVVTKTLNNSPNDQDPPLSAGSHSSGTISPTVNHEVKILIKRIMIKVADVINPARKTCVCVEWARRISEEYFSQTDEEKQLGLPVVMPHFDRNTCSLPKSQITFIDYFLTNMCDAWHEFCCIDEVMSNLSNNYSYWQRLQEKGIMKIEDITDNIDNFDCEVIEPGRTGDCIVKQPNNIAPAKNRVL